MEAPVATAEDGTKSVAYSTLIPVLIEAIKEQQQQIRELKETLMLMRSAAGIRYEPPNNDLGRQPIAGHLDQKVRLIGVRQGGADY